MSLTNLAQPLTPEIMKSMKLGKVMRTSDEKRIVWLDFDDGGENCVIADEDDTITLYDCVLGRERRKVFSKKYGVKCVRFAHSSNNIIHSSTKEDNTIRYLSLHDNRYLRYFKGHKGQVVSLEMSPVDDTFISGALDDTVRLWDLRSPICQGVTHIKGQPCVAIDPKGLVFAIGLQNNSIRLYDLRNYEQGPFGMVPAAGERQFFDPFETWSSMKFSNNGVDLLVATQKGKIYVIDTFDYKLKYVVSDFENNSGQNIEACFTPDAKFLLSGSENGIVHVWDASNGKKVVELPGHTGAISVLQFNPTKMMMVSGCNQLGMWIPALDWGTKRKQ